MSLQQHQLLISTRGRGLIDISAELRDLVQQWGSPSGLCHCFVHHTSASLLVMENADPAVLRDLERFMQRLVPDGDALFEHREEGPDDMPAHVRSALTHTALSIPVRDARLDLGTWQGVFLWEHRHAGHRRRISISLLD